jgi:transposase
MARRYGRSPRGERLDCPIPHGHWKSTTFLAGLTGSGFIAPYVLDGAMTGELFLAWTEQMLAPELRPGDLVIMDNLPAHKVKGIRKAIEAQGAELLYLPPYSPDLNPIENAFAKLKALLRSSRANGRGLVERHRPHARLLPACRVRQLHRQLRLSTVRVKKL